MAEEARLTAVAAGLIKEGEAFNKEQAAYAESVRQNAQAEYARLQKEKEADDQKQLATATAHEEQKRQLQDRFDALLVDFDKLLADINRQYADAIKTVNERYRQTVDVITLRR